MDSHEKHQADEEEQASFLPRIGKNSDDAMVRSNEKRDARRKTTWYLRLLLDVAMAMTIVYLLFLRPPARETIRRTPVPTFPRKIYTFRDNPKYVNGDMFFNETETLRTLHNWIELSSGSRGFVVIGDGSASSDIRRKYDLPEPYDVALDRYRDGKGYMVSAFHQLHCLSYIAEHYQQGYAGRNLTGEVAHHTAHCFNYLRQGIMCAADTTLEGKTEEGPGEGSEHECADYAAVLEWANTHSSMKWRGNLPEESTL